MGLFSGAFSLVGDVISTPFDAVSDASKALQGKEPTALKKRVNSVLKDVDDMTDLDI